ncbi:transcriptional regulator, IclR family [Rhizobium sp. CF080]|uniref:IclR family transcriptional regulator n=1 Tax=Rhizobium sp. (strain CF080) TaxID=1144310 RepID=UPI000271782F|nr:helix-turn-helix domain-containing protein [Rhizobium sp. CF080]EUB99344.1 transcriptional regulator, IclR family [Rhizobium sp. CF080]
MNALIAARSISPVACAPPELLYRQAMDRKSSSNVERAAEILLAIGSAGPEGLALSDIAEALDDTKSAIHRALQGLAKHGFVEQSSRRGRYRLGPTIYALSKRSISVTDLVETVRPALVRIGSATRMSTYLMVHSGLDCICLDFQEGIYPIRALLNGVGGRIPLGVSVAGVCILSTFDPATRKVMLEENEAAITAAGFNLEGILAEAQLAAERGFAVRPGMDENDVMSLAVVLPRDWVHAAAAIAVVPPWRDVDPGKVDEIVRLIRAEAARNN